MTAENKTNDIGYKKPPAATQFQKGKSGNPKGRPKGSKNNKTIFESLAQTEIEGKLPNGEEKVTILEAIVAKLAAKAVAGDQRAINKFVDTMAGYDKQNEDYCREAELAAINRLTDNFWQAIYNAGAHFSDKECALITVYLKAVELEFRKFIPEIEAIFDSNKNAKPEILLEQQEIASA